MSDAGQKGKVSIYASTTLDTALAGAQPIELVQLVRLAMQDEKRVEVLDESPTGDPALRWSIPKTRRARTTVPSRRGYGKAWS